MLLKMTEIALIRSIMKVANLLKSLKENLTLKERYWKNMIRQKRMNKRNSLSKS